MSRWGAVEESDRQGEMVTHNEGLVESGPKQYLLPIIPSDSSHCLRHRLLYGMCKSGEVVIEFGILAGMIAVRRLEGIGVLTGSPPKTRPRRINYGHFSPLGHRSPANIMGR